MLTELPAAVGAVAAKVAESPAGEKNRIEDPDGPVGEVPNLTGIQRHSCYIPDPGGLQYGMG